MKSLHFGSAMIDIITLVASENIEQATFTNGAQSFLMLEAGRKLPAQSITTHVGGGGCNTAVVRDVCSKTTCSSTCSFFEGGRRRSTEWKLAGAFSC